METASRDTFAAHRAAGGRVWGGGFPFPAKEDGAGRAASRAITRGNCAPHGSAFCGSGGSTPLRAVRGAVSAGC